MATPSGMPTIVLTRFRQRAIHSALISAHLESGHYFNPHAQRIIEGKMDGAKLAVIDSRLSNTASMANYWMPTKPGSEAAALLAMAHVLLKEKLYDEKFLSRWVNWNVYMEEVHPQKPNTFEQFIECLTEDYASYTPEYAADECGISAEMVVEVARQNRQGRSPFRSP